MYVTMELYHPPLKFPHVVCLSITPHLTFMLDSQSSCMYYM